MSGSPTYVSTTWCLLHASKVQSDLRTVGLELVLTTVHCCQDSWGIQDFYGSTSEFLYKWDFRYKRRRRKKKLLGGCWQSVSRKKRNSRLTIKEAAEWQLDIQVHNHKAFYTYMHRPVWVGHRWVESKSDWDPMKERFKSSDIIVFESCVHCLFHSGL